MTTINKITWIFDKIAKQQKNPGFINYTRPGRLLKMFISKMKNAKKLAISKQIATITHTSTKRVVQDFNIYKNFINAFTS